MTVFNWQLQSPVDSVIFDCDGTLSAIEGIDTLAEKKGVSTEVEALTHDAMTHSGINLDLYQRRLVLTRPTQAEVNLLGQEYIQHCVADAASVIKIFKRLNKSIYIISAGLLPAVAMLGEYLQIPRKNIFAVNIQFNSHGDYDNFDHTSPLVTKNGKRILVAELKKQHKKIVYVGDGMNDCAVIDSVTRFIGYGGAYYRENIAAMCDYYITTASLAPLLPLSLTQDEYEELLPLEKEIYNQGIISIKATKVMINLSSSHRH